MHVAQVLTITVFGCANGSEAVTIASELEREHPGTAVQIRAGDIDPECLLVAQAGRYHPDEVFNNKFIEREFVASTFYRDGPTYVVRPELRERIEFARLDVLDPALRDRIAPSDIVFAQNFLFHLKPAQARRALHNILSVVKPGGALFLDGVDLPLRQKFARHHGLLPLPYQIERIHNEARRARAVGWPYSYWGLEPFQIQQRHWPERYATIFFVPRAG